MKPDPNWLLIEIAAGLQKLCLLSLERSPPMDVIDLTAQAWLEAITEGHRWDERRDAGRVRTAFRALAKARRTWPVPADFLEALPRLEPLRALPLTPNDPARAERSIAEVREILRQGRRE